MEKINHNSIKKLNRVCFFFLSVAPILFWSCHSEISISEYNERYNKCFLSCGQDIKDINITMKHKPSKLMAYSDFQSTEVVCEEDYIKACKQYSDYLYFDLLFSKNNRELLYSNLSQDQYANLFNQLTFNLDDIVSIYTQNGEKVHLFDWHIPRYFGMKNATQILLVFKRDEINDDFAIQIKEFGLETGDMQFSFNLRKIEQFENKYDIKL